MTLDEFRKDKTLMREAAKLSQNPTLKVMLAVIKDRSPIHKRPGTLGLPAEDKAQHLGQIEGHAMCLDDFRLMFEEPNAPIPHIPSTFRDPIPKPPTK